MTHLKEEIERVPLLGEFRSQNQDCPEQRIMVEGNANGGGGGGGGGGGAGHSVEIPETAHQISTDSWFQACFVLTSGINSAYVLGYSGTVIIHLGWITGVVGMLVVTALSLYASTLPVKLHELGGRRHIRYRDLAGYIYGKKGYYSVWTLQYINLFMINIGFIILAGSALKDVYSLFDDDNGLKLSYCNLFAGFACFTFAIFIPHLSALRVWLGFSTVLSSIYITIAIVLSVKDGITEPERDYSIPGMFSTRVFTTIGSLANLFVTLNTGMLPEIQATVREPNVSNMMKALYFQFTVGLIPMYVVVFVGYWAYGASTSSYLLDNTTGPTWVKALANIAAFLQAVISFHIFASPSYEYFDTKYNITGSPLAIRSLSFRIGLRGTYLFISSMAAALIPFLGDCLSLTGALCTLPLTFVIPNHMYLVVKKNKLNSMQKLWHLLNVCVFGCWSIAATVAAVRLTIVDTKTY